MNYSEMIDKALKGRSVNSLAKEWGLQQRTLDRYVKGQSMPDFTTVRRIAKEAGISGDQALEILELEEQSHKVRNFKLQMGYVHTTLLTAMAAFALLVTLFMTSAKAESLTYAENLPQGNNSIYIM